MTIDWALLLGTQDICGRLKELYIQMSAEKLAGHLGVSTAALKQRLALCGITMRARGGPRYRFPREWLPADVVNMTPEQIAHITGYCVGYARRLRRQIREEQGWSKQ